MASLKHPRGHLAGTPQRWVVTATLVFSATIVASTTYAQGTLGKETIPPRLYHAAIVSMYDGNYAEALKVLRTVGRGAIKTTQSQWIDSICYYTMAGECYYHMGQLNEALEAYTSAIRLYNLFSDWLIRVRFTAIRPGQPSAAPWGASTRGAQLGQYSAVMGIDQGVVDLTQQFNEGAASKKPFALTSPVILQIEVQEIVRCTTLAIRRRTEILGPLSKHDPVTQELIANLSRRPGLPNHWSLAWVDLELGLALVAGGKETEAIPVLTRSLEAAGQFDHPLTSTALFELGRLALMRGDYAAALQFFQEASISAYQYFDGGILEESFRYGMIAHLLSNQPGVYPPLQPALQSAKRDLRQLKVSLLVSMAENMAVRGQAREAAAALDQAQGTMGRRTMAGADMGARLNYVRALLLFQQRKVTEGDQALAAAMAYMQHGSAWLEQIRHLERLYSTGQINDSSRGAMTYRTAVELYGELLRDPGAADWGLRPMEALSVLATPHSEALEHWFLIAMNRKEHEAALEIADRARRHRFLSSLPYGGRLQSLRWILEAPEQVLDQTALLDRQNLLAQYPAYGKVSQQARQVRTALEASPLVTTDNEAAVRQRQGLEQLATFSNQQEAILREIAVRREKASLVFPPLRLTKDIQRLLPEGQVLLDFFSAGGDLYAFLLNRERYSYWRIKEPAMLRRKIETMLHDMGHFDANRELTVKELLDTKWKESSRQVLDAILAGSQVDFTAQFPEMVIVPDGILWYVPFEALQVNIGGRLRPLIDRFRIRYAPTASLAVPDGHAINPSDATAVVLGRLFPRQEDSVAQQAFSDLSRSVPRVVALPSPTLPAPSYVYGSLVKQLVVLDDLQSAPDAGPYAWAPIPTERNKPGNSLADWLALPWGGPDVVILPGFHTAAERALARVSRTAPGSEVFLSICGLMASGTRTILLSRWRTGGQSSFDLVREFAQEIPYLPPSEAWKRAVLVVALKPLNLNAEPRVKQGSGDAAPQGNHPFVWAGYLLVDSGTGEKPPEAKPTGAEAPPAGAATKPNDQPQPAAEEKPGAAAPKAAGPGEPAEAKPQQESPATTGPADKPAGEEPKPQPPATGGTSPEPASPPASKPAEPPAATPQVPAPPINLEPQDGRP